MTCPWSAESLVLRALQPLNGFVPTYVNWAMSQTDAPAMYHLGTALAAVAATIPPDLVMNDAPWGDVYSNLYVMVVGRQGTDRKSTAISQMLRLLETGVPGRRSHDPSSVEALVDSLAEQPQQLLVYEDMADILSRTQHRSGGNHASAIKAKLLPLFDCNPVSRMKVDKLVKCSAPRLSFLGAVNPALLSAHTEPHDWEGGLFSRFLVFYAMRERLNVRRARVKNVAVEEWLSRWMELAAKTPPSDWGPYRGVSPGAMRVWEAFQWAVEQVQPIGRASTTCGAMARTPLMANKIAFILQFSERSGWPQGGPGQPWQISRVVMETAVQIAMMCYVGSLSIAVTTTDSREMRQRSQILDIIGTEWTPFSRVIRNGGVLRRRAMEVTDTLIAEKTIERLTTEEEPFYRRLDVSAEIPGAAAAMETAQMVSAVFYETLRDLDAGAPIPSNGGGAVFNVPPVFDEGFVTEEGAGPVGDLLAE